MPEQKKKSKKTNAADVPGASKKNTVKQKAGFKVRFGLRFKFALAIIVLVTGIIITMALYFMNSESEVLKKEMIRLARREIDHLHANAVDALSTESELQLLAAIGSVKEIESIKYAYILDRDNRILQNLDLKKNGEILNDAIIKKVSEGQDLKKTFSFTLPDKDGGYLYDFSKVVHDKIFKKKIGIVRLGFSDKIIRDRIGELTMNIIIISSVFIGISVLGAFVLASITINPIKKLTAGAAILGTGNLDYKITLKSSDEIGQLAREFNTMTEQLKQAKNNEIESRIMEEQLEIAKEIQEGLNPMSFYNKDGIQIKGFTRAAKGVGGDYFDYVDIDATRVGALLSDVSGKGVPASLVMVMIRTVFVTSIHKGDVDCASIVTSINDSLSSDFAIDKFATLFFMIYNRKNSELSFTNAGHGPLFCYRAARDAFTLSKLDGVPIGLQEDVEYKQGRVSLNPGDIVTLYSDGVTEMRNKDREEYGRTRLQKLIAKNNQLDAKSLVDLIVTDVDAFRGEVKPHDDMTVLVLKRVS